MLTLAATVHRRAWLRRRFVDEHPLRDAIDAKERKPLDLIIFAVVRWTYYFFALPISAYSDLRSIWNRRILGSMADGSGDRKLFIKIGLTLWFKTNYLLQKISSIYAANSQVRCIVSRSISSRMQRYSFLLRRSTASCSDDNIRNIA